MGRFLYRPGSDGLWGSDLRVGLQEERWSVTLFAENLTDEKYLEENITAPEFGGSFIHPGSLRRAGVELAVRF